MKKIKSILFSCIGRWDRRGAEDDYRDKDIGGIARALLNSGNFSYSKVIIFSDKEEDKVFADSLNKFCQDKVESKPTLVVESQPVNPMDRPAIYTAMRQLIEKHTPGNEQRTFLLSSGTPAMHLCWTLLGHTDKYSARLIDASKQEEVQEVPHWVELHHSLARNDSSQVYFHKFLIGKSEKDATKKSVEKYEIIGNNAKLKKAIGMASHVAERDFKEGTAIIYGETGTGKEAIARLIHGKSEDFVPINCGSLNKDSLESELFGHKKGSFTGAYQNKKGLLRSVKQGGTLFLDEIGDMPLDLQVKLLRALQERVVLPVGGEKEEPLANFRIVAATHKSLDQGIKEGWFREDLFYRLKKHVINLPPLRDRLGDIDDLCKHFIKKTNASSDVKNVSFSEDAFLFLKKFVWAGNIRELENTVTFAAELVLACATDSDFEEIKEPIIDAAFLKEMFDTFPSPTSNFELTPVIENKAKEIDTISIAETTLEEISTDTTSVEWANRELDEFNLDTLFQDVAYHYYQRVRKHFLNENMLGRGAQKTFAPKLGISLHRLNAYEKKWSAEGKDIVKWPKNN